MKVQFSNSVEYIPTWRENDKQPEADQIKTTLKVLNMGALMDLMDAFSQAGLDKEIDTDQVEGSAIAPLLKQFGNLLPAHVELTNLSDQDGNVIDIAAVVEYPIFLNLALELLMKLAEVSSPSDTDTKN